MTLEEFKMMVFKEFGENLEKATPANVREFIAHIYSILLGKKRGEVILLEEEKVTSFSQIIREFFWKVFNYPPEYGFIMLWLMAFELYFAAIEFEYAEKLAGLFGETEKFH